MINTIKYYLLFPIAFIRLNMTYWIPLCKIQWGELTVTLTPNLWCIISDGQSDDAMPINFTSEKLQLALVEELKSKWWYPGDRINGAVDEA